MCLPGQTSYVILHWYSVQQPFNSTSESIYSRMQRYPYPSGHTYKTLPYFDCIFSKLVTLVTYIKSIVVSLEVLGQRISFKFNNQRANAFRHEHAIFSKTIPVKTLRPYIYESRKELEVAAEGKRIGAFLRNIKQTRGPKLIQPPR